MLKRQNNRERQLYEEIQHYYSYESASYISSTGADEIYGFEDCFEIQTSSL